MSEEDAVIANVTAELASMSTTHTVEQPTNQASDTGMDNSASVDVSVNVGGDTIITNSEKVTNPQKVADNSDNVLPEKSEVTETDENVESFKTSLNEAVAKSPASDVQKSNSDEAAPSDAPTSNQVEECDKSVETNKAVVISSVSEIVIIEKGVDDSSSDDEIEKKSNSFSSEKAHGSSVENGSRPDNKNSSPEEQTASGSEMASKTQERNGRRRGNRYRTKSGGQSASLPRSDTENGVETTTQQSDTRVRTNSYRPYRGGRGRGRRRGRGRGGFNGGLSSPPFRQNFGEAWNYGANADSRYRLSEHAYRVSNGNRDRPGYYAARIVRGTQNKPKPKNDEVTASSQANAGESVVVVETEGAVNNSLPNEESKRGRRRGNYRNRTRSGRFVNDSYHNEVGGATGGVPVEPKRQNYYRYSYRTPNYPRYDYHGQMHGFYDGYYRDGGYNRPYYGYGNSYGYGRGSSRGYNGGGRRGGFRPRSKSNANQPQSTANKEVANALNGNANPTSGTTDLQTTECLP